MRARRLTTTDDETPLWQSFKRQGIQQAVVQLMCREGLQSVTMERVAQEAGIAKGTVYLHYRDKQQLLDEVKESSLAPLIAKLDEILSSDAGPEQKLRRYAARYLAYFDERRDLFRILLYEREVTRVQSSRYHSDRYRHLVDGIARAVRDGIRKGTFRDVDARGIAAMFVDASMAIMNQRLLTEKPLPVEEDAKLISDLFLRGLKADRRSAR